MSIKLKYKQTTDELHIKFKKQTETPIVITLDNGVILEFDHNDNLLSFIFPKFKNICKRNITHKSKLELLSLITEDDVVKASILIDGTPLHFNFSVSSLK